MLLEMGQRTLVAMDGHVVDLGLALGGLDYDPLELGLVGRSLDRPVVDLGPAVPSLLGCFHERCDRDVLGRRLMNRGEVGRLLFHLSHDLDAGQDPQRPQHLAHPEVAQGRTATHLVRGARRRQSVDDLPLIRPGSHRVEDVHVLRRQPEHRRRVATALSHVRPRRATTEPFCH